MNVLSLYLGPNASAVLFQKGRITGAVAQERFNGIKNTDSFPHQAIDWLLGQAGLSAKDVDKVALCGEAHVLEEGVLPVTSELVEWFDLPLCHAFAPVAYYGVEDGDWLVFTSGARDLTSAVNLWDGTTMKRIATSSADSSWGEMYGATTEFLGMRKGEHDAKVMGLAAYADKGAAALVYDRLYKDIVDVDIDKPLVFRSLFPLALTGEQLRKNALGVRFDHLAGGVQMALERGVVKWIKAAVQETGVKRIMTSGSVFANVKLNKLIREMPEVEEVLFMPSGGNEIAPFGAAFACHRESSTKMRPVGSLFLGPSYDDGEIGKFLANHPDKDRFEATHPVLPSKMAAGLLARREVVARFAGRAEFGARSLGNRAILAHPADRESFFTVNELVKRRDFWMPFAPTILDKDVSRLIVNPRKALAPYMIEAFDTTDIGRSSLCAAMHAADKTVRPQILTQEANPSYYALIESFREMTGIGAVLNTSFNLHGDPLATSPEQAMATFMASGLRYMLMEGWLVEKRGL